MKATHLFFPVVLACATISGFSQGLINLTPDPLVIEPGRYFYIPFNGGSISGRFNITNPKNDVVCLVLGEDDFINWQNGHEYRIYHNSGKVATGTLDFRLRPGQKYYLVFSNTHSVLASATVVVKAAIFNNPND